MIDILYFENGFFILQYMIPNKVIKANNKNEGKMFKKREAESYKKLKN